MAKKTEIETITETNEPNLSTEDLFTVEEFCQLKDLGKYYIDSLVMSFGNEVKKTANDWKTFLVDAKLIKEEQIR